VTEAALPGRPVGTSTRWPWAAVGLFAAFAVAGLWLLHRNGEPYADQIPFVIAFGMFGVVGALILSRVRRNRIGALLLYGSMVTSGSFVTGEALTALVRDGVRSGVLVSALGLASNLGWVFGIMPVVLLLPQLFPDGKVLSPRWKWVAWTTAGVLLAVGFGAVVAQQTLSGSSEDATVRNPLYMAAFDRIPLAGSVVPFIMLGALGAGAASVVVRFRRSRGVERQQLKWVLASLLFVVGTFLLSALIGSDSFFISTLLNAFAWLSIPVAIAISVLQYRLYDLDVVVKKALIAGTLAVIVIAVYGAVVSLLGAVASGRRSSLVVFLTALLLGVAFRPVTGFARRIADRLVYGRRATPYEVLTAFSERVGDAYATDDLLGRMAQILGQGVGAERARVWLHVGDELRPAGSWPADAEPADAVPVGDERSLSVHRESVVEVRDRGELLGALSVAMPLNDPMTPAKEKLVRDLASQAGLALRNVRLVEELKASQRRIVAAQDLERRRLERNIHDGAQQQLVALTVKMRLAETLAMKDGERTAAMLEQMRAEAQTALEDLRDLARGSTRRSSPTAGCRRRSRRRLASPRCPSRSRPTASAGTPRRSRPRSTSPASRRCRTSRSTRTPRTSRCASERARGTSSSRSTTTARASTPPRRGTARACRG
jgi:signal transduction histidine kinase